MKKLFLVLIACSILSSQMVAQNARPSKKELLKMWSSLPAEGQTKLLNYSKEVSKEYSNVAKTAEAAPVVAQKEVKSVASQVKETAPTRTAKVAPQATETNSLPKQQPTQNQVVEPQRTPITVSPATTTPPTNSNVVSTVAPRQNPATATNITQTPDAKPADTRPDYQVKAESMTKTTISWDSEKFEFGKIKQGDATKHEFRFKNTGTQPLLLTYVRPSCGCTATNWTKETVAPGGEGVVEITFNSSGKQGQQHKVVTVFANTEPIMQNLQFTGDVFVPETGTPAPAKDGHEGHNH